MAAPCHHDNPSPTVEDAIDSLLQEADRHYGNEYLRDLLWGGERAGGGKVKLRRKQCCAFLFFIFSQSCMLNLYFTGRILVAFGQVTQYLQAVMRLPYGPCTHEGDEIKWNRPPIYTHSLPSPGSK